MSQDPGELTRQGMVVGGGRDQEERGVETVLPYARGQRLGGRTFQCDATAVRSRGGMRAFALLDGIGDSEVVREWTRAQARLLAEGGLRHGEAYSAVRALHAVCAYEAQQPGAPEVGAVAVLAVMVPGRPVTLAWCGDARAYLYEPDGEGPVLLTRDHNQRQRALDAGQYAPPGWRHSVTSALGDLAPDPEIGEIALGQVDGGRLLLASDGAYEPVHDHSAEREWATALAAPTLVDAVRQLLDTTVWWTPEEADADNATVLVTDLPHLRTARGGDRAGGGV
ncbi:PP2C family protein-serine/threonine phosphatase [Streptomyces sp. NPDC087440]|uniref:PP2C family protein-serine/threonine phosphatase n=1 Tax=Streptomyces sp. NPDC087440 TaxID=3365790 RepID=UPI0037F7867D